MNILLKLVNSRGRVVWHVYPDGDRYTVEDDNGRRSYRLIERFLEDARLFKYDHAKSAKAEGDPRFVEMFNKFCGISEW